MKNKKRLSAVRGSAIVLGSFLFFNPIHAQGSSHLNNVNLAGGDIGFVGDVNDANRCEAACNKNGKCKAWTWVRPGALPFLPRPGLKGFCALKGSIPNKTPDNCCVSGYTNRGGGNNNMVTGTVTGIVKEVDMSRVIPSILSQNHPPRGSAPSALYVMENGSDRPGKDYRNFEIDKNIEAFVGAKRCEDACKNEHQCKAYTYVKPGIQGANARCYLKNGVPPKITSACCASGIVRPTNKGDYCQNYANDSVQASRSNTTNACGYTGGMWSSRYKQHFDWCMRVSKQEVDSAIAKRNKLITQCLAPSVLGDLAAYGTCYEIDKPRRKVIFYPLLRNVGNTKWKSNKSGTYTVRYSVGSTSFTEMHSLPSRKIVPGEIVRLRGVAVPFKREVPYQFNWYLTHPEDQSPGNNNETRGFTPFDVPTGYQLEEHPWLLANRACTKIPIKHSPLNLYWDKVDLNGIPLNPKWGWQLEHVYGKKGYYPDLDFMTNGARNRYWRGIAYKVGEDRDFSTVLTQKTIKEYGPVRIPSTSIKVGGTCGPHVNWTFPVTFTGVLKAAGYDPKDHDLNFYLYTPEGVGTLKHSDKKHEGGIKVEFNAAETVDHFHTPWWSSLKKVEIDVSTGILGSPGSLLSHVLSMVNGKYAIVTAMFGFDCAHECDSELHPAWAMAIRAEDKNPNNEVWAIFVRNWGNEGFCSDHIFTANFPKVGNKRLFKFLIPWRPGATGVSVNHSLTRFLQRGEVKMIVTPFRNYGVVVTFSLAEPNQRPRINGELHLRWTYPTGAATAPYPLPPTAVANAKTAASTLELEDTKMVNRILQQLPPEQRATYKRALRDWNQSQQIPSIKESAPLQMRINVPNTPSTMMPTIGEIQNATMNIRGH